MTTTELKRTLDAGEPIVLLDVREDDERDFCSILTPATAVNLHIPIGQVQERLPEIVDASAGGPVVVYCHHGQRSGMVARWLPGRGVADVHNLEGGIDAWSIGVDPGVRRY